MKLKTKRVSGLTGSQRDYGLVTGSVWNYEDKPTSNNVGTTLSAVPRDEATIEAERGETVVGDLDNDGMVEHAKIGGKRHPQGGTPLNVPDGSFVFSDYRGLLIKNKDVLKNIFGMSSGKAVTPAKVAQRYEINKFKHMLNDPFIDPIDRKTAQLMIDNNMRKLGQLALIQEGMKGFPDGIPAIAMPLMGSDVAQQGGQQKMRKGGTVQYKRGGLAKHQGPKKSQVDLSGYNDMRQIPINLQAPDQDPSTWNPDWNNLPDWLEDIDQDGMITPQDFQMYQQMNEELERNRILNQAKADAMGNFAGVRDNTNLMSPQRYTGPLYSDITLDNGMVITAQDQIARDNYLAQLQNGENPNGTISQTPDYKVPGTASYYLNNAADIAMHPGSYLGYLMTPGDQGRFGTYLQNNTNPVNDVLDIMALRNVGLMPYLGGMYAQGKLQEKNEEAVQPKAGLSNLITGNMPQTNKAGIYEFVEENPGTGGALGLVGALGTGALLTMATRMGLKNAGILKKGLYSEGKPYYNMGLFKNSKGLYGAGRPYLERRLALREAGKWSPFPGINLTDKVLGKNPGMYTSDVVDVSIPGTTSSLDEFASGFNMPSEIAQRTARTKLLYGVGDDALVNRTAGLRPKFADGKSIWENPNLYNMPYKDYFSKGNAAKRAWEAYKTPIVVTGAVGATGAIGAGLGKLWAKNRISSEEIKKQQEQKPATFTGSTAYEDKKFRDWLVGEGVDLKAYDTAVDSVKNKWLELYKQNPNATFTIEVSNEADDVGGSVVPVKEEKKEDKKEEKKAEEKKESTTSKKEDPGEIYGKQMFPDTWDTLSVETKNQRLMMLGRKPLMKKRDGGSILNKVKVSLPTYATQGEVDEKFYYITPEKKQKIEEKGWNDIQYPSYSILQNSSDYAPEQKDNFTISPGGFWVPKDYTSEQMQALDRDALDWFRNHEAYQDQWGTYNEGGYDQFEKDLAEFAKTKKPNESWEEAERRFQSTYGRNPYEWAATTFDTKYFNPKTGVNYFDYDENGKLKEHWEIPGLHFRAIPKLSKKEIEQKKKKDKKQKESKQEEDLTIPPPNWQKSQTRYPRPRLADLMGEWGAAMQEIRRYPSMYAPVRDAIPETIYDRFNAQPLMGAYTTALQNAGTGPEGTRAIDNIAGKVMEGVAQGQEQVQTQVNNPRFINLLTQGLQAKMATDRYNAAEKIRFSDDISTKWQDYLANYNKKLANVTEKAANTAENQYKLALMKAMYPYANIDYDQSPTANATLNSITDEPVASSQGTGGFNERVQQLNEYYRKQGYSKTEASKAALDHAKAEVGFNKMYSGTAMSPFNIS